MIHFFKRDPIPNLASFHYSRARLSVFAKELWVPLLPLVALPMIAVMLRNSILPWQFMWLMAFAFGAGCKWLTWFNKFVCTQRVNWRRTLGYLMAWPGMDAKQFLDERIKLKKPFLKEWLAALSKTMLGLVLLWVVLHRLPRKEELLVGWLGLIGLGLLLHFGSFHLLSLVWRSGGVLAEPIMRAPALATSLSEFWGQRWNVAFHQLATEFIFRPLQRRLGVRGATMVAFLVSGLIHELVISLPAGAGYGGPTVYFLIQGMGVLTERTAKRKELGLQRGWRGWLFTIIFTVAPVFWLFHPPFLRQVILPFLKGIGAL